MEGMEKDSIAKRVYIGGCTGSHSVGLFKKKRFGCQASKERGAG